MRKMFLVVLAIMFMVSVASVSFAADPLKVGTGSKKGFYTTQAFPRIAVITKQWDVPMKAVPGGSRINIKKLQSGKIDLAMVQFDALIEANDPNLLIVGFMHPEVIHALTRWDHSINEFSDVKKGHKVAIGKATGGSALTWDTWASTISQLADVETESFGGTRAINALESGDIDVFFSVTGMGNKYFRSANKSKKTFKLVEIDFSALTKLKYKKNPIYSEFEIESKHYPNLIKGFGDPDVLTVNAVLITTADWADEYEDEFEVVADAVRSARTGIIAAAIPKL